MIKTLRIFCITGLLLSGVAAASETMRLPKGEATGDRGPSGCPVFTADVKIKQVDSRRKRIAVLEEDYESMLKIAESTRFRIPGVDAKESGVEQVRPGSEARVRYCGTDGTLLELKVLRSSSQP